MKGPFAAGFMAGGFARASVGLGYGIAACIATWALVELVSQCLSCCRRRYEPNFLHNNPALRGREGTRKWFAIGIVMGILYVEAQAQLGFTGTPAPTPAPQGPGLGVD